MLTSQQQEQMTNVLNNNLEGLYSILVEYEELKEEVQLLKNENKELKSTVTSLTNKLKRMNRRLNDARRALSRIL